MIKIYRQKESFRAGKAGEMMTKIINVLSKKVGIDIELSPEPYSYSNSYGRFDGYFAIIGDGSEMLRLNVSLGKSDKIVSVDIYEDVDSIEPDATIDTYGMNIVQIINEIGSYLFNNSSLMAEKLQRGVKENPLKGGEFEDFNALMKLTADDIFEQLKDFITLVKRGMVNSLYVYGSPGCLSKDTKIKIKRFKHKREYTIEDVYNKLNKISKKEKGKTNRFWNDNSIYIQALDENSGTLKFQKIKNIYKTGKKQIFQIKTKKGLLIKTSENHLFRVNNHELKDEKGFVPLKYLKIGDKVVCKGDNNFRRGRKKGRRIIYNIPYHPYAWNKKVGKYNYKRLSYSRIVVEASINNISIPEFINIIKYDQKKASTLKYLPAAIEVHHKDEDVKNDNIDNLEALPKIEHLQKHCKINFDPNCHITEDEITEIIKIGEEETFDIEMEYPICNFLANEFIVHNSGKTKTVVDTLEELNADYEIFSGGIKGTSELVRLLYRYKDNKIIVLDDFDSAMRNKEQKEIMKAALQDDDIRLITYIKDVSQQRTIPERFEFTSRIIFISNSPKIDPAIKSRSMSIQVELSQEDMLLRIRDALNNIYPAFPIDIKLKVWRFLMRASQEKKLKRIDFRQFKFCMSVAALILDKHPTSQKWKQKCLAMLNA